MTQARFFVCTRTNWQGSTWGPVAGPFATRKEAEAEAEKCEEHYVGPFGLDLKTEVHSTVRSIFSLRQAGWKDERISDNVFSAERERAQREEDEKQARAELAAEAAY